MADAQAVTAEHAEVLSPRKTVFNLAAPALVEMFLVSAVGMADMMMVGRIGPAAIASVGLTNQPMMFFQAVYMSLNVGTTALVARLVGARDMGRASAAVKQTLAMALLIGVVISVLSVTFAEPLLHFMGAEPDVIDQGVPYFKVVGAGLIFQAMAMNMTASLRGAGDTRSPMTINIISNICNLIGNYVLINGVIGFPKWGVFGAGLSTTLSRIIAFVLFYRLLASGTRRIKPAFFEKYSLDWPLLQRAIRVGIPAAIEQLILRAGQVTFALVVSSLGTVTYAAHQVGLNVLSMAFMPGHAFAVAATTLVGQGLGADRPDEAERYAQEARKLGMIVGCGMAVLFFSLGRQIAWLYTDDKAIIEMAAMVLRFYAFVQPAQTTQFVFAGALRGAGDTRWTLYSSAIGIWVGRVVMSNILVGIFHLGIMGAWMAMAVDQVGRSVITSMRFRTGRWKTHKV